jgi:hypothetical protein|nr:hypothetical protein [Kofleriaceae bacterium]
MTKHAPKKAAPAAAPTTHEKILSEQRKRIARSLRKRRRQKSHQ